MSNNKNDFTTGSIFKKLIIFMIPILGSLILQAMYSAVDTLVIGKFGSDVGLSGVSTGSSIVSFVTFTIAGFATGVTVQIGKYLGMKQNERIGKVIGGAVIVNILLAIVFTIILVFLAEPIATLMKAPEEAFEKTVEYIRICGYGCIFIVFYNLISCIFRGLGNSKLPLLFVAISCVINIVLDLVFVICLKLDVVGVALATVIAQAVSVILSIIIICKTKLPFTITKKDFWFNKEVVLFTKVGFPIALQEIITNASFLILCLVINGIGLNESSGYAIGGRFTSFVMLIPSALIQSLSSFISQNVGAGLHTRARQTMVMGMIIGVVTGIAMASLSFFGGEWVSSLFAKEGEDAYIATSAAYLKGFAPEAIVTCILFSFNGYFSGYGKSKIIMVVGILQSVVFRLPLIIIMSKLTSNLLFIGLAMPITTVMGIGISIIYYLIIQKQLKSENNLLARE